MNLGEGMLEKKILLIDDEQEILYLLDTVLRKEGFTRIYKAMSGREGLSQCKGVNPDIIILDIMLPDLDGFEVCRKLREMTYAPILFLSAKSDDVDKLLGLGIGGDDYITKPFSPKEVAFRVKAQLRRTGYMAMQQMESPAEILKIRELTINPNTGEVIRSGQEVSLTAREFQLLLYMAQNANRILSKKKLCDAVWGEDFLGFDNTIMVHIRHLREKIEEDPGHPTYIKTVKGLGYKLTTNEN